MWTLCKDATHIRNISGYMHFQLIPMVNKMKAKGSVDRFTMKRTTVSSIVVMVFTVSSK